jgi:hypothetical protein
MLRFWKKVFDDYINGTQAIYTSNDVAELLGSVDHLTLSPQVDSLSGGATLTVQVEHSPDGSRWMNRNTAAEFTTNLVAGNATFQPVSDGSSDTRPTLPFVRIRMQLGSAQSGLLRLWVAGRDPAR